jgi:hypothetical protein
MKKNIEIKEFKQKVMDKFCEELTDQVFLMIEQDRNLLHEYMLLIAQNKSLSNINSQIAKAVKNRFDLDNKHQENKNPNSKLIQAHERFE